MVEVMPRGDVVEFGRRVGGADCFVGLGGSMERGENGESVVVVLVAKVPLRDDLRRKSLSFREVPRENMFESCEDGVNVARGAQLFEV